MSDPNRAETLPDVPRLRPRASMYTMTSTICWRSFSSSSFILRNFRKRFTTSSPERSSQACHRSQVLRHQRGCCRRKCSAFKVPSKLPQRDAANCVTVGRLVSDLVHWRGRFLHGVRKAANAGYLHLHDITDIHGAGVGRGARQHDVAGQEGDVSRQVGKDVIDGESHLADRPVLHHLAVDIGSHAFLANIDATHNAGADGAEPVLPLYPEHGAGIRITE